MQFYSSEFIFGEKPSCYLQEGHRREENGVGIELEAFESC